MYKVLAIKHEAKVNSKVTKKKHEERNIESDKISEQFTTENS